MKKFTFLLMLSLVLRISLAAVTLNGSSFQSNGNSRSIGVAPSPNSITANNEAASTFKTVAGAQNLYKTGNADDLSSVTFYLSGGFMSYTGAATITFDGTDYDYDNGLGFTTIPCTTGNHTYVVTPSNESKAILRGAVDVPTVDDVPVALTIVNGYKVEIFAIDNTSNPIEGATVIMDGQTVTTDATGDAVFLRKAGGTYTYSVTKTGYSIIDAHTLTVNTADVIETATLQQPSVTFYLSGGFMSYTGAATITFDGTDYDYDNGLGFNTIPCTTGTHTYVVTPLNESKAILRGTVDVPTVNDVPVALTIVNGYKVEIFTTDNTSNPIEGATVIMDGQTVTTDATGDAIFMRKASGTYPYTAAKTGYGTVSGTATLASADLVITAALEIQTAYKVSFTVYDNSSTSWPPAGLEGATVIFNGNTAVTDANGMATLPDEPNGTYDYTVTKAGFVTYSGTAYIEDADAMVEVYMNVAHSLQFTVTDGTNPIPNASIRLVSNWPVYDLTFTTNAQGVVLTDKLFPNWTSFDYTISADGFADAMGTVNIEQENLVADPIALQRAYELTFTVNDGSNPVMGASVLINNTSIATDASGMAIFPKMINGNYFYVVSAPGYVDMNGNVTVTDGNAAKAVTLAMGYNLTFNVINGPNGTVGLANDTITINGISKITNVDGMAVFGVAPNSAVSFTNRKAGFADVPVNIANVASDMTQTINMVPVYNVIIRAFDGNTYNPIAGATVVFNSITATTDAEGSAYFPNTAPSTSAYDYSVTGDAPYNAVTGTISLPFTSTEDFLYSNNVVTQTEYLTSPGVYIALQDGLMSYFGTATITFDGTDYEYNTGLGGNSIVCGLGTHTYVITPDNVTKAIIRGTVELTASEPNANLWLDVPDAHKIEIYTIDANSDPIAGAAVTLDGITVLTDYTGLALFDRYPAGSYTYTITKQDYASVGETALAVNTDDVMEVVTLDFNTGIRNISAGTIKLYPNPTRGILHLNLAELDNKQVTVQITNIIGKVLYEHKLVNNPGEAELDLSGFDNGIYFVKVIGDGFENSVKVVKN